jgi:hypothetical protein
VVGYAVVGDAVVGAAVVGAAVEPPSLVVGGGVVGGGVFTFVVVGELVGAPPSQPHLRSSAIVLLLPFL